MTKIKYYVETSRATTYGIVKVTILKETEKTFIPRECMTIFGASYVYPGYRIFKNQCLFDALDDAITHLQEYLENRLDKITSTKIALESDLEALEQVKENKSKNT